MRFSLTKALGRFDRGRVGSCYISKIELGDEELAQLLRLLEKAVRQVCSGRSAEDQEDICQKTAIKVMQWVQTQGREPNFTFAFLRKSAYHTMIDEIRRGRTRQEESLTDEKGLERDVAVPSADPAVNKELGQAIEDCLAALIPDRKRAMALCLLGHPNREIAELMGWVAKKTENLVSRARKDMRRCLVEKGLSP